MTPEQIRTANMIRLTGYRETEVFKDDSTVILRRARKEHDCCGGHNGERRVKCTRPIVKGEFYIEYLGESPLYSSGQRYHLECAAQQKLIERAA